MGKQSSRIIWGRTGEDGNAKTPVEMYDPIETIYVKDNMALVTERVNDQDETRCYICKVIESAGEWETVKNDWRMLQSVSKYDTKKEYKKGSKCIYDGYYWNCTHDITRDDIMRHINDDVLVPTSENYWEHVMQTVAVSYHAMDHKDVYYDDGHNKDKWHKAMWFVPDEDWFDEEHEEEIAEWDPNRQYEHIETKEKGDMVIKTFSYISGEVRKLYECRVRHTTAGDTSWHPEQWREVDDVTEWDHHVAYAKGAYVIRGDIPVGEFIICKFGDLGGTAYFKAGDKCIYYIDRNDKTSLDPDIRREYSALPEWVKTKVENVGTRMSSLYQLKTGVTQPDMNNFQRSEWILIGQAFDLFIGQDYSQGDSVIWNYSTPDPEVGYTIQSVCVFTALENLPALQPDQTPTADPSKWGEPWKQVQTAKPQVHLYKAKKNLTPNMNDKWRKENWIICTQMMKTNELDCYGWIWKKLVDPRTHGLPFYFCVPERYYRSIGWVERGRFNLLCLNSFNSCISKFYPYLGGNMLDEEGRFNAGGSVSWQLSGDGGALSSTYRNGVNRAVRGRFYSFAFNAPEGDFWHNSVGHANDNRAYGSDDEGYRVYGTRDGHNWSTIELEHPYMICKGISVIDNGFIYVSAPQCSDIKVYKVIVAPSGSGLSKMSEECIYTSEIHMTSYSYQYYELVQRNGFAIFSYSMNRIKTRIEQMIRIPKENIDTYQYYHTFTYGVSGTGSKVNFEDKKLSTFLHELCEEYYDKEYNFSDRCKDPPTVCKYADCLDTTEDLRSDIEGDTLFCICSVYYDWNDYTEYDYPYDPWPGYTEWEWARYYRGHTYAHRDRTHCHSSIFLIYWTQNSITPTFVELEQQDKVITSQDYDDDIYYKPHEGFAVNSDWYGLGCYSVGKENAYISIYGAKKQDNDRGYCRCAYRGGGFTKLYNKSLLELLHQYNNIIPFPFGQTNYMLGWQENGIYIYGIGDHYDHDIGAEGYDQENAYRVWVDTYDASFLPYYATAGGESGALTYTSGRLLACYYYDRWSHYWNHADVSWYIYLPDVEEHPSTIGGIAWVSSAKDRSEGIGSGPFYGGDRGGFDEGN